MRESLASTRNPNNRPSGRTTTAIVLFTLLAVALYGMVPFDRPPFRSWDLAAYITMAEASPGLAENVSRHFGYRVLGPWIAGQLPFEPPVAFRVLTTAALVSTALAFLWFLLRRGISRRAAVVAALAFVLNKHLFGYPAWNPFQAGDALAMLALVLLYDAILERRWASFAIVFFLGMLARESVILALPAGAVVLAASTPSNGEGRVSALARLGAAALPGLAVTVLLRLSLETSGDTSFLDAFLAHAPKLARIETWLRLLVNALAPLVVLPILFPRTAWSFFRARPDAALYVALVFASTLLGSNDERLMGPAFLVFYWLIAVLIDTHLVHDRRRLVALVAFAALAMADHLYARFPLPGPAVTAALTAVALAGAAIVAGTARRSGGDALRRFSGGAGAR